MGLISHRVKESDLKASDHIYVYRPPFGLYSHHGIYLGGGMVVHFSSAADSHAVSGSRKDGNGVSKICLKEFLKKGKLRRYKYGVQAVALGVKFRGGATTARSDPPEEVIRRAEYLLENGFGDYNLVANNCEMFALYCKTGRLIQGKGGPGQVASAASVPFSFFPFPFFVPLFFGEELASFVLGLGLVVEAPVVLGFVAVASSAALLVGAIIRYGNDIGVRADAVKVEVEDLAQFRRLLTTRSTNTGGFPMHATRSSTPVITDHLNPTSALRFQPLGSHHPNPTSPLRFQPLGSHHPNPTSPLRFQPLGPRTL